MNSSIINELDIIISEHNELIKKITSIAKQFFEHFLIIVNSKGIAKTHILEQNLPMDITVVYVCSIDFKSEVEQHFLSKVSDLGDAIYIKEILAFLRKSKYMSPYIAELVDSRLVFTTDDDLKIVYMQNQEEIRKILNSPLSKQECYNAHVLINLAEHYFSFLMTQDSFSEALLSAGYFLAVIEDALNLLNKTYWYNNLRYINEELEALTIKPNNLLLQIDNIITTTTLEGIRMATTILMKEVHKICDYKGYTYYQSGYNIFDNENIPKTKFNTKKQNKEKIEQFHNFGKQRLMQAAKYENKHIMFLTLFDVAIMSKFVYEDDISERVISIWNPNNFDKMIEDFIKI